MGYILVAEDDEIKARLVGRILERLGHGMLWCSTIVDAQDTLQELAESMDTPLLAVITDWSMPIIKNGVVRKGAGLNVINTVLTYWKEPRIAPPLFVFSGEEAPAWWTNSAPTPEIPWFSGPDGAINLSKILAELR